MSFNEALNEAPSCLNGEGDLLRHGAARLLEGLDQDKLAALEETLGQLYACIKEKRWKKVPDDVLSSIWASCTAILLHGLSGVEVSIRCSIPIAHFAPSKPRRPSASPTFQTWQPSGYIIYLILHVSIFLFNNQTVSTWCRRVLRHCTFFGP